MKASYQNFVVLNLVFSAALLWVEVCSGDLQGSVWHEENGELELRNKLSCKSKGNQLVSQLFVVFKSAVVFLNAFLRVKEDLFISAMLHFKKMQFLLEGAKCNQKAYHKE